MILLYIRKILPGLKSNKRVSPIDRFRYENIFGTRNYIFNSPRTKWKINMDHQHGSLIFSTDA